MCNQIQLKGTSNGTRRPKIAMSMSLSELPELEQEGRHDVDGDGVGLHQPPSVEVHLQYSQVMSCQVKSSQVY